MNYVSIDHQLVKDGVTDSVENVDVVLKNGFTTYMAQVSECLKPFRGSIMKKIYIAVGNTSVFMGPGRKEFNPKKSMPGFEHYLKESINGTLAKIPNPDFDEGYISNFMAGRFIKQGNLAGFLPVCSLVLHKPCYRLRPVVQVVWL